MPFEYPKDIKLIKATWDRSSFCVYTLSDSEGVRYIGKTGVKSLAQTFYRHTKYDIVRAGHTHKVSWLKKLKENNQCPIMTVILGNLEEKEALTKEIELIAEYRIILGEKLTNLTDGGEGITGYHPLKESVDILRERMLTNNPFKGRHHSNETKNLISIMLAGNKHGPHTTETKRKISLANKGKHPLFGDRHQKMIVASLASPNRHKLSGVKKPIIATNVKTGETSYFESTKAASEALGPKRPNITMALKNGKIASGYTFVYYKEEN